MLDAFKELRDPRVWRLWVAWIALFLLSYPATDFVIHTIDGTASLNLAMPLAGFVAMTVVLGAVFAFGMASTFKYVADDFPDNMGVVTGIVRHRARVLRRFGRFRACAVLSNWRS